MHFFYEIQETHTIPTPCNPTGPTKVFLASKKYDIQLTIEKTGLSHQVWSHGGSLLKKNITLNGHFSRPAQTDLYEHLLCSLRHSLRNLVRPEKFLTIKTCGKKKIHIYTREGATSFFRESFNGLYNKTIIGVILASQAN